MRGTLAQTLSWLNTRPSLRELCEAFPEEWTAVQHEIAEAVSANDQARLHRLLKPVKSPGAGFRKDSQERYLFAEVRRRMATLDIERRSLALASGKSSGKVRFNLINGFIAQRLLFKRGFERKPVSLFWFRLFWPLLWQKRFLMPLVKQRGIYCFYSRELIARLAELIGNRSCLEIAAGDGTLSRFLKDAGVDIRATDDHSWKHDVDYPNTVLRMDARTALEHYSPEVVICSWPPAGNDFERQVFRTRSVSLYIGFVSEHRHASGNWTDYETQSQFSFTVVHDLSRLLLPPELGSVVCVFRRNTEGNDV
jgi:hypothetical protein